MKGVNNKLKTLLGIKRMNLSEAFDFLEGIAKNQQIGYESAMLGFGDYEVSNYFERYSTTQATWANMTEQQQQNRVKTFLNASCKTHNLKVDNLTTAYYKANQEEKKIKEKEEKKLKEIQT